MDQAVLRPRSGIMFVHGALGTQNFTFASDIGLILRDFSSLSQRRDIILIGCETNFVRDPGS